MNRKKDLLKNVITLGFGTLLPQFSSLITLPIITGSLTKTEMGSYDLITSVSSLLIPIATLQIQAAAFRFIIDNKNDADKTKRTISTVVAFFLPIAIATSIFLLLFLKEIDFNIRLLVCLYYLTCIIMQCFQQIARGFSFNKLYSFTATMISISNALLVVVSVGKLKLGLIGVLFSLTVANMIGVLIIIIFGKMFRYIDLRYVSFSELKKMIAYSWPLIPNSISNWVLSVSDRSIISLYLGLEATAIYSVSNKIPSLLNLAQGTFVYAWQENASLAEKDDDKSKYYSDVFSDVFDILCGIMSMLIGFTPVLFVLLIHGDYSEAYNHIPILLFGFFFSTLSSFFGGIYIAYKRTKNVGITTVMAAIVNLVIDLFLVKKIGIYAASISTLVSYFFLSVYRMVDIQKFQPLNYNYVKIILRVFILTLMAYVCSRRSMILNIVNGIIGILFCLVVNRKQIELILNLISTHLLGAKDVEKE